MKVGFVKHKPVESAVARAFQALGHVVSFKRSKGGFERFVKNNGIDLLFLSSSAPIPSPRMVQKLQDICHVVYWERRAPPKSVDNKKHKFKNYFTVYKDDSGIYLPCAAEDHLSLKKDDRFGVSLVAKNIYRKSPKGRHKRRRLLQERISRDIANRFTLYGDIPEGEYDNRFEIMANSSCSIGIWNVDNAIPLRYFEIISTSTPLITYPCSLFREFFVPGQHYIETESLSDTLDAFQADPKKFEDIGVRGYKHFLEYHTYRHRVKFILRYLRRQR